MTWKLCPLRIIGSLFLCFIILRKICLMDIPFPSRGVLCLPIANKKEPVLGTVENSSIGSRSFLGYRNHPLARPYCGPISPDPLEDDWTPWVSRKSKCVAIDQSTDPLSEIRWTKISSCEDDVRYQAWTESKSLHLSANCRVCEKIDGQLTFLHWGTAGAFVRQRTQTFHEWSLLNQAFASSSNPLRTFLVLAGVVEEPLKDFLVFIISAIEGYEASIYLITVLSVLVDATYFNCLFRTDLGFLLISLCGLPKDTDRESALWFFWLGILCLETEKL